MAYGVNGPFGLLPCRMLNSATWNGQSSQYFIDTGVGGGNLFLGDPVIPTANGVIRPAPAGGGAGGFSIGVFMGCRYIPVNITVNDPLWYPNWTNGTAIQANTVPIALVVDDPNTVFSAQVNAAGNLVQTNMFNTVNWALDPNGGNTTLGTSRYTLDFATIGNDATLNFKMLNLQPSPNNAANQPFNVAEGIINNHFLRPGVAGI